jgi:hypothetical protein
MFGLETIKAMNADAALAARLEGRKPVAITTEADIVGIPNLGDACEDIDKVAPRLDTLFVDISGWGSPNEPALTQEQFFARLLALVAEHGTVLAALSEVGQFQGYVAVWKAADLDPTYNSILL